MIVLQECHVSIPDPLPAIAAVDGVRAAQSEEAGQDAEAAATAAAAAEGGLRVAPQAERV